MVKHIILWQLKDDLQPEQKAAVTAGIKQGLEGLQGRIPGLTEIRVVADHLLPTSNADVMLDCTLESFDALKDYAVHPLHVAVADGKIRPFTKTRVCIDYEV
ncbi:MAG: Dabb family protein [Clostridia bacterium]|nr:Dabb family protein [Clostridia bacterium]